jgi:hypothetical protein
MTRHGWHLALWGFVTVTPMHFADRASSICRGTLDGRNAAAASLPIGDSRFSTGSASTTQRRAASASETYGGGS